MEAKANIAPSGLMAIEDVAEYMGVPVGTVRRLRRLDRIPFHRIGAKLYTRKADLDKYIEVIFGEDSS